MSRATERRQSWLDVFADYPAPANLAFEDVRRNIGIVDECLQDLWNLGENIFLAWTSRGERTLLLALPYYLLAEYVSGARPIKGEPRPEEYVGGLISGSKHLGADELQPDDGVGRDLMSALVQRYGLAYTRNRPVLLVDIVGFSLFPAMEQVVLLQSLSYSVNSAYSKLAARNFRINFARSTTGDGFYIWNRDDTLEGSAHLYTLMLLMLADNAIAQSKARSRTVPRLRTAFHVGPHYEFYQSEGLSPTRVSYLVGEVTITLARLLERAMPGQVLLGDFEARVMEETGGETLRLGTTEFVERMRAAVSKLSGIRLAGEAVREIRCYLTGPQALDGSYGINRYRVADKHGIQHALFNAKINIHREAGESIFLGIRNQAFEDLELDATLPQAAL